MDVSSVEVVLRHRCRAPALCVLALLAGSGCGSSTPPSNEEEPVGDVVVSVTESSADEQSSDSGATRTPPIQLRPEDPPRPPAVEASRPKAEPANISSRLRLPDDRPDINEERLKQAGIRRYESRRLVLLSDLPEQKVAHLPALADKLFERLEQHFGRLPTAVDDSDFQVTGCIIADEARFRAAELMRSGQFTIKHGRHFNYRFWMYNVDSDYYRRHLMLHEFTHCFMSCESGMNNLPPLWYFEGMAEYFATHQWHADEGQHDFGILPATFDGFAGWGRVSELRRSFQLIPALSDGLPAQLKMQTLNEVIPDVVDSFLADLQYASSWAVCWFLQNHPEYSKQVAKLAPLNTAPEFIAAVERFRDTAGDRLAVDWLIFQESLREGFDVQRSWPVHVGEATLPLETKIAADHDWQDTGIVLEQGNRITIACSGRYQVNNQPKPWISEPQGVSIEYFRGIPLGCVIAILTDVKGEYISAPIRIGREATITAPLDCRLWLQINDSSASRTNNNGQVAVQISATR